MAFDITEALLTCELFATLTNREIEPLVSISSAETYRAGEKIFSQGDHGSKMYVVGKGHVTLERTVDLGERTATITIATLGRGRAFGCWSSIIGHPHNVLCSALCSEPTEVIGIDGAALRAALHNDPLVGFKILEKIAFLLGERLRGVYGAMEKL